MIRVGEDSFLVQMTDYNRDYYKDKYEGLGEGVEVAEYRARLLLSKVKKLGRVLDVGCGYGDFLRVLQNGGVRVYGVDVSSHAIKRIKSKVNGKFYILNIANKKLPFKDNYYDGVAILDVLEHIKSSELILREALRVLKPGGLIFVTTPNHQGFLRKLLLPIFPDDPTHVNILNYKQWYDEFQRVGYKRIEIWGCLMHAFPPLPVIRRWMRVLSLPIRMEPIFIPFKYLCGQLYIFARK